jgi:hypothetical protein
MTLKQICIHERLEMAYHSLEQHNQHVWCWLVAMLEEWSKNHPIVIKER